MLISEGGLGIRNLIKFNHALLGKWLWHYGLKREAWWRVMLDSKYGRSWGGWCSSEPVRAYGVCLWKNIRRDWKKFCTHTKFEVGDCSKVRFCHGLWYGDMALTDTFPVLLGISSAKDASVAVHVKFSECSI